MQLLKKRKGGYGLCGVYKLQMGTGTNEIWKQDGQLENNPITHEITLSGNTQFQVYAVAWEKKQAAPNSWQQAQQHQLGFGSDRSWADTHSWITVSPY